MDHLSIDLETFSSVPIQKVGAQKYIQSPDFEILLFVPSRCAVIFCKAKRSPSGLQRLCLIRSA